MKLLVPFLTAVALSHSVTAMAQSSPVLIELYTSQGCSSCPPADRNLKAVMDETDTIILSLHVDYWDYIGWKDPFALPENGARQSKYARAVGSRHVYTPQMVINGRDMINGGSRREIDKHITRHKNARSSVSLEVLRDGGNTSIRIQSNGSEVGLYVVDIVQYMPHARTKILRGENAGETYDYHNIVTKWETIATWNGVNTLEQELENYGNKNTVVVVQKWSDEGPGPIEAATVITVPGA